MDFEFLLKLLLAKVFCVVFGGYISKKTLRPLPPKTPISLSLTLHFGRSTDPVVVRLKGVNGPGSHRGCLEGRVKSYDQFHRFGDQVQIDRS